MIPKNLRREHIESALDAIDRDGVPADREATGFALSTRGRTYPPKLVVSRANEFANGRMLRANEFSGGKETNGLLVALGYQVKPIGAGAVAAAASSAPPKPGKKPAATVRAAAPRRAESASRASSAKTITAELATPARLIAREARTRSAGSGAPSAGPTVATVILESSNDADYDVVTRFAIMRTAVEAISTSTSTQVVAVFSGGWFKADAYAPASSIFDDVVKRVRQLLARHPLVSVTFGMDGLRDERGAREQLAVAVTADGVVGVGRKFHPAPGEEIEPAKSWDSDERGFPRIAVIGGKRFYLAVCYDGFGIKHRKPKRPDVDAVLDHVHSFARGESEVLFARHGFAGAAQQWGVPVYGSVIFFDRSISPKWPSGVRWEGPPRSTMAWSYADNPMFPSRVLSVDLPVGRAEVRFFE